VGRVTCRERHGLLSRQPPDPAGLTLQIGGRR